jgi:uncharacterized membrane protein YdfJ with MMPL/SSD domain
MIGIGMLVALLIHATVVRALLVPPTMKLLGEWKWWAPGPLARWCDRCGGGSPASRSPWPATRTASRVNGSPAPPGCDVIPP